MRTRFEARQVLLSPAFPILMAWGLFTTLISLTLQRDPDGRPTYPTTLSMIPELESGYSVIPLVVAIFYAGELVWRERDRSVHEIVDAAPMPNWAYVVPKTLAMALVLVTMLLTTVVASVVVQLTLGYTDLELDKYLFWYVLPMAWDILLLAALAVFVQAISPHKAVGWGVMVLFLIWRQLNTSIDHNVVNYGGTPPMPLSDLNGAGSFWIGTWVFRVYWGAFAVLLLVAAHLLWRRGTDIQLKPRLARAGRHLRGVPGRIAAVRDRRKADVRRRRPIQFLRRPEFGGQRAAGEVYRDVNAFPRRRENDGHGFAIAYACPRMIAVEPTSAASG